MDRFKTASRSWAKTIVAFESPPRLREVGGQVGEHAPEPSGQVTREDQFKIRLAHNDERTRDAKFFVEKRYGEVGYHGAGGPGSNSCPDSITLATYQGEQVIGTQTLGFDVGNGLMADELYKAEIDMLRARGCTVAEITKFALDTKLTSKRFLAAMFNVSYIYLRKLWRYSDAVIEVNPTHAAFYKRMLGFKEIGSERMCPRVHAPAVLLWLDLVEVEKKVAEVAGQHELAKQDRTLYPYFFPPQEEARITDRLLRAEPK
ncbi:MAG: hypothetical protein PHD37_09580 [Gallionellaceae bacterium]|nr:hypothetical protein [Gallionellaceae bacterium]